MSTETRFAPLTEGHTDNRFAVLRSLVEGEWLPAPILDTRAEADGYARGFLEACQRLRVDAITLVLDLSTGEMDDLDTVDEGDLAALRAMLAEEFGVDGGSSEQER